MNKPNEKLKHARRLRSLTQEDLAMKLDTTIHTVSRWERGTVLPNPYFRRKLIDIFGMSVEELGFLDAEKREEEVVLTHSPYIYSSVSNIESQHVELLDERNSQALSDQLSLSVEQSERIDVSPQVWRMRWFLAISVTISSLMTLVVVGVVFYLTRNLYILSLLVVLSPLLYILSHMTRYYFSADAKK